MQTSPGMQVYIVQRERHRTIARPTANNLHLVCLDCKIYYIYVKYITYVSLFALNIFL